MRKLICGLEAKPGDAQMLVTYETDITDLKNMLSEKERIINELQNPDQKNQGKYTSKPFARTEIGKIKCH